jgi:hypothetical protein
MASTDVPWWGALILAILTCILSVVLTIYLKGGNRPSLPGGPTNSFFTDTITYIPHILILFGVFADIFTMKGVYSIPSLVGILAMPASKLMSYLWTGLNTLVVEIVGMVAKWFGTTANPATIVTPMFSGTSTTGATPGMKEPAQTGQAGGAINNYAGCTIQGFEGMASQYAPQTLVVTATIFAYYMLDLLVNRSASEASSSIVAFIVVYGAQAFVTSCQAGYWPPLTALAEGFLFGGGAFGIVNATAPQRLPSSVLGGKGGGGGMGVGGVGGDGSGAGAGGGGGNASNDPNLKDLGSNTPASAQSCPAGSTSTPPPAMSNTF